MVSEEPGEKGLPEPDDRSKEAPPLAKPADRQAPKEKAAIVVSAVRLSAKGCSPMMQLTRRVFNSGHRRQHREAAGVAAQTLKSSVSQNKASELRDQGGKTFVRIAISVPPGLRRQAP